jgi:hypothetical protein
MHRLKQAFKHICAPRFLVEYVQTIGGEKAGAATVFQLRRPHETTSRPQKADSQG